MISAVFGARISAHVVRGVLADLVGVLEQGPIPSEKGEGRLPRGIDDGDEDAVRGWDCAHLALPPDMKPVREARVQVGVETDHQATIKPARGEPISIRAEADIEVGMWALIGGAKRRVFEWLTAREIVFAPGRLGAVYPDPR